MSYINGVYSVPVGPCQDDVDLKYVLEAQNELEQQELKTKHARDLIPSINQQAKIRNLLSTLRPNQ